MDIDIKAVLTRIDLRLVELGIPKEKFYAESGISSASYSQWNTGTHKPSAKKLNMVADYLGISPEYLLTGEQKEKPTREGELTEIQKEAMAFIRTLSPEQLSRFIKMGEAAFSGEDLS